MNLPAFRYHPDPLKTGSIVPSDAQCVCCQKSRGYIYTGPVYGEENVDDALCPWCIADGSAHKRFAAEFVDAAAFSDDTPESTIQEIRQRTPGYSAWQSEAWPACCKDATAFLGPYGIADIRAACYEREADIMTHIVQNLHISGSAARRLLESLHKDQGPTVYLFQCLRCLRYHLHIDHP